MTAETDRDLQARVLKAYQKRAAREGWDCAPARIEQAPGSRPSVKLFDRDGNRVLAKYRYNPRIDRLFYVLPK